MVQSRFQALTHIARFSGCKDPAANNYNAQATINDGSCKYNTTTYVPPIKVDPMHPTLVETSGLQMAGNFLWSFNDGSGEPAIYRIDTLTNALLQTVNLGGATNVDWEDIAFDGTHFYVGDFGNNANGARTDLKIYKFALSAIPDYTTNSIVTIPQSQINVINFIYADQVQPPQSGAPNTTRFDCEAMFVDAGKIHLFSKNWVDTITTHYVIADTIAGSYTALPLETLATKYLVTAADKAVGQNVVALFGYQAAGFASHFLHFLSDYSGGFYFNGNKRQIDLPDATIMGQGEGLTFRNGTYGYISNEKFVRSSGQFTLTVNQKLRSFNAASFVSATVLPITLKQFNAANVNGTHQIKWNFDGEVNHLQLQQSTNGQAFSTIKSFTRSLSDVAYNNEPVGNSCYRLLWQAADGSLQYSNQVCISSRVKQLIKNVSITSGGQLSFTFDGSSAATYTFKILSVDGKLMAVTRSQLFQPGYHKIQLPAVIPATAAIVMSEANGAKETTLVQVLK